MLSLSPAKLLVILVIALIVLGPEKLPQVARQIGAAWHDLRGWRARIESEVRGTFPNLPPTHEVAQAVRSPLAFLDRLADEHERTLDESTTDGEGDTADATQSATAGPAPPGDGPASGNGSGAGNGSVPGAASIGPNGSAGHNGSGAGVSPERSGAARRGGLPVAPDDPSMN